MKGVVLAAGRGTRLLPITKVVDKTWLPVGGKPVIFYAIEALEKSGIREAIIITNSFNRKGMETLVGSEFGKDRIKIDFKTRNHNLGMPFSILQAKDFAHKDSIMVIPGDNIFIDDFSKEVNGFTCGAVAFLRKVKDPSRFGMPIYKNNKLVDIKEKPKKPEGNLAITAPYFFDNEVFRLIRKLKPSKRGELEVVDLLKLYLKNNGLSFINKNSFWKDIGTFDSYLEAGNYFKRQKANKLTSFEIA